MEKQFFSITEVADIVGMKDTTIRKYEKDYKLKTPRNEQGHRYYTNQEIDVLKQIKMFKEQGYTIHQINDLLGKSVVAIEQEKQALELVTIDKLTGADLKRLMAEKIAELVLEREQELKQDFENKLVKMKEDLREEIKQQMREEFEWLEQQQEEIRLGNKIITRKVERIIENEKHAKRGFFSRFFKKEDSKMNA